MSTAINQLIETDGLPADYFMALSFDGEPARATVTYHPAFFAVE